MYCDWLKKRYHFMFTLGLTSRSNHSIPESNVSEVTLINLTCYTSSHETCNSTSNKGPDCYLGHVRYTTRSHGPQTSKHNPDGWQISKPTESIGANDFRTYLFGQMQLKKIYVTNLTCNACRHQASNCTRNQCT